MNKKIKMNFEKDIREQMIKLLKKNCGNNFNKNNTTIELIICYLNSINRRIYPKERRVCISDKIRNIIKKNIINGKNSKKEQEAIKVLKEFKIKFENGEDMNGHLSKNIYYSRLFKSTGGGTKDWKSRDYLLDDWGIHHIHLNLKNASNEKEMSNNRGDYLLYIKVTDETIYFIDVTGHITENFNNIELLETMDRNWPYLLERYLMPGVELLQNTNSHDIKKSRRNHQLLIYNVNGKVYFPMGGGLNSAGSNILFTERAEMFLEDIGIIEESIIREYDVIKEKINGYHGLLEFKLECLLKLDTCIGYLVTEKNTGFQILFHIEGDKLAIYYDGFTIIYN